MKELCPDDAEAMDSIEIESLPDDLQPIAEIVGIAKAIEYAETLGGVTVYLMRWDEDPEKWNIDIEELVQFFGIEHARQIVKLLAPGAITIPNCKKLAAEKRHHEIVTARGQGVPVKLLARKYKLHERMIRRITKKVRDQFESNQLELI